MPADSTLNDKAWRRVCNKTGLISEVQRQGYFIITAEDLKSASADEQGREREPRLMAKLDCNSDRPAVFVENQLNILPVERGTYVVFADPANVCYFRMPANAERTAAEFRPRLDLSTLDTLSTSLCSTESEAVELAYLSSLLSSFAGAGQLTLTRRGRFSSGHFSLTLPGCGVPVSVQNAQIEVDSIYEGQEAVLLIEAKMGFRDNFHIRQLHYPYEWLRQKTGKPIKSILLCYSNGEFQLSEFKFGEQFGDIALVREQEYWVIGEQPAAPIRLERLLMFSPSASELMSVPFPQADDLDKVVDVVQCAHQNVWRVADLMDTFGFVSRQAHYYVDAARYLGFLEPKGRAWLTKSGHHLINEASRVNRTETIIRHMILRPVFREALILLSKRNYEATSISNRELQDLIQNFRSDLGGDTVNRRAGTVKSWLKWLTSNCVFEN